MNVQFNNKKNVYKIIWTFLHSTKIIHATIVALLSCELAYDGKLGGGWEQD